LEVCLPSCSPRKVAHHPARNGGNDSTGHLRPYEARRSAYCAPGSCSEASGKRGQSHRGDRRTERLRRTRRASVPVAQGPAKGQSPFPSQNPVSGRDTICSTGGRSETQFSRPVDGPGAASRVASADTARDTTKATTADTSSRTTSGTATRTTCGTTSGTTSRTSRDSTRCTACYSG